LEEVSERKEKEEAEEERGVRGRCLKKKKKNFRAS